MIVPSIWTLFNVHELDFCGINYAYESCGRNSGHKQLYIYVFPSFFSFFEILGSPKRGDSDPQEPLPFWCTFKLCLNVKRKRKSVILKMSHKRAPSFFKG